MSLIASSVIKEALCYPCALRMSILFNYPPPSTVGQLLARGGSAQESEGTDSSGPQNPASNGSIGVVDRAELPMIDEEYHPRFSIAHETVSSVQRYFSGALAFTAEPPASIDGRGLPGSTACGMLAGDAAATHAVSWLCVACMGLYQFMDLVHAPLAAAAIRMSPYSDATAITINVNVNRSFTFTWLAAATRFYDMSDSTANHSHPAASSIVKQELSNFKDFYMSDLRARVLGYLLTPHAEVLKRSADLQSLPGLFVYEKAIEEGIQERDRAGCVVSASFLDEATGSEQDVRLPRKIARVDREGGEPVVSFTVESAAASSHFALQGFRYSGTNDSLIGEVFCRHHATEGLITEGHMPAVYCGNRSTEVLPYSVVYEYAVPYLNKVGWGPIPGVDTRFLRRPAATLSCHLQHANIFLMGTYCKMMRNMSQSPWFLEGHRIGSFSLQEIIANPVLPFFFPNTNLEASQPQGNGSQIESSLRETTTIAPSHRVTLERGTHASRWQSVAPSVASSAHVFGYGRYKFHSAGREDVDVRMLGSGRPFVLELISPLREKFTSDDLRRLEGAINESYQGSVEVSQLRTTDAEVTVRLARHSESKIKHYRCVIWSSRPIHHPDEDACVQAVHTIKDMEILQGTPLRVLHRRSLHQRPRIIHSMKLTAVNAHWFILDLETQAGTYVKEFVHGDMGRTVPHLGMLLNARTDIVQLDVVGMAMQDLDAPAVTATANPQA